MTDSLRLSVPDLADPADAEAFYRVADAARDLDGHDPFNDQARVDVAAGRRSPVAITVTRDDDGPRHVGSAIVGRAELDLVIDPAFRGLGYGRVALEGILPTLHGAITAWSHGDHPAARVLARRHGFEPARTLLRLRLDPLPDDLDAGRPEGVAIETFRPGADDDEWVALNAEIFERHPEQGALQVSDLQARQDEPWFDAGDFLVARDATGRMVAYNWLKLEPGIDEGEIYVVGVAPTHAGRGLGKALMLAGLRRLRERGRRAATLYVESDNDPAVRLYRSLGFVDDLVDVQYVRPEQRSGGVRTGDFRAS